MGLLLHQELIIQSANSTCYGGQHNEKDPFVMRNQSPPSCPNGLAKRTKPRRASLLSIDIDLGVHQTVTWHPPTPLPDGWHWSVQQSSTADVSCRSSRISTMKEQWKIWLWWTYAPPTPLTARQALYRQVRSVQKLTIKWRAGRSGWRIAYSKTVPAKRHFLLANASNKS